VDVQQGCVAELGGKLWSVGEIKEEEFDVVAHCYGEDETFAVAFRCDVFPPPD
jgi:hypothetical protein